MGHVNAPEEDEKRLGLLREDYKEKSHSKTVEVVLTEKGKAHDERGNSCTLADTGSFSSSSCK